MSAIIPTYNRAHYLPAALDSVLAQTAADLELIVVDDGSTDQTRRILEPYGRRIRYSHQEHRGEPTLPEEGLREFAAFPEVGLMTFRRPESDAAGRPTGRVPGKASPGAALSTSSLLREDWRKVGKPPIRASCLERVGGFNEELLKSPDMEMWLRFSLLWPMREVARALYLWRRLRARLLRRLSRDWLLRDGPDVPGRLERHPVLRAAWEAIRLSPLTLEHRLLPVRVHLSVGAP